MQFQREQYAAKRDAINQNLYLKLRTKVSELKQSMDTLASKEDLSGQMKLKLEALNQRWVKSSGKFGDISTSVDDLFTAKFNVEKVLAILQDYQNLDSEVEEMKRILSDREESKVELLTVYKKLKMLNVVRMKLVERVENTKKRDSLLSPKLISPLSTQLVF